jgi:hypothetical protein
MTGHTVIIIYLGIFFIPALVVNFKRANRAVFHAGTTSQTFIRVNHDVLAAGRTQVKKLGQAEVLFLQLCKVRNRSKRITALIAHFQFILDLPVQDLTLGTFLLSAFRRTGSRGLKIVFLDNTGRANIGA